MELGKFSVGMCPEQKSLRMGPRDFAEMEIEVFGLHNDKEFIQGIVQCSRLSFIYLVNFSLCLFSTSFVIYIYIYFLFLFLSFLLSFFLDCRHSTFE
jgi:hypothetical protein